MSRGRIAAAACLASVLAALGLAGCGGWDDGYGVEPGFVKAPLEITDFALFDLGVADIDGDGALDLFTSNHNGRSGVFLGDGAGGFGANALTRLGLDQDRAFPGLEDRREAKPTPEPGLHVFWHNGRLLLEGRGLDGLGPLRGRIRLSGALAVARADAAETRSEEEALASGLVSTTLTFAAKPGAAQSRLVLKPDFVAVPVHFSLDPGFPLERVHVGAQGVHPASHDFVIALRDRHGQAWADFDGDDDLDVFAARGGLKGEMSRFPETYEDELLCGREGRFVDCLAGSGLEKKATRARAAAWLDYDRDGKLDLHVRGWSSRDQLFRQGDGGRFEDVAPDLGLDAEWTSDSTWLDVEQDGDLDLLMVRRSRLLLLEQEGGRFRERALGETQGAMGKFSLADYDRDGDLDVFRASPKGNLLLTNHSGSLEVIEPASLGLPETSVAAHFVDYDNDGRSDLHAIPGGLYRQGEDGKFEATGLLASTAADAEVVRQAWFDADRDGALDLVVSFRPASKWLYSTEFHRAAGPANHWLEVDLIGPPGNRQAIGAFVALETRGGTQVQEVGFGEASQFSQGLYRLHFGLGRETRARTLRVEWPDGATTIRERVRADRILTVSHPTVP